MRWRALALVSLGVNFVLAALLVSIPRSVPQQPEASLAGGQAFAGQSRTNVPFRRLLFSWQEIESQDYPTYIANLRQIGCPEQTIRDIIIADVNGLYARRRATELVTPEQQWWRSEPDTNVLHVAAEKARVLDTERRTLLARLLGGSWESGDMISLPRPSRPGVILDGPVLGSLSAETKQAIQNISASSEERLQAYLDSRQADGKSTEAVELAKLRQQTREELARVLSPGALEEYLLRYSQEASNLREAIGELQYFNTTPDEFRAVFRATDSIDQQLQLLADSTDPASVLARRNLEQQRENAIRTALGSKRYEEYTLLHDPRYRDAVATAREAGDPASARTIYQINVAATMTQDSIQSDTNMTASQKAIELKQLELDQLTANAIATGQQLPQLPPLPPSPAPRYTVRPGDNAAVIGMIYGVPESAIRAANPSVDFNRIKPGDSIRIPRNALGPAQAPVTSPAGR
jgi:LysM repeat protein